MTVRATFDTTPGSVALAQEFTREVLNGVPLVQLEEIVLMVSELAINAIAHTATTMFGLSIERTDHFVRVEVTDDDGGNVTLWPREDHKGSGLQLVNCLSDQWGTVRLAEGGKSVWFIRSFTNHSDAGGKHHSA